MFLTISKLQYKNVICDPNKQPQNDSAPSKVGYRDDSRIICHIYSFYFTSEVDVLF